MKPKMLAKVLDPAIRVGFERIEVMTQSPSEKHGFLPAQQFKWKGVHQNTWCQAKARLWNQAKSCAECCLCHSGSLQEVVTLNSTLNLRSCFKGSRQANISSINT